MSGETDLLRQPSFCYRRGITYFERDTTVFERGFTRFGRRITYFERETARFRRGIIVIGRGTLPALCLWLIMKKGNILTNTVEEE
ncbi:hypothetical protein [Sporosarcina koreensis]|uniref:Uncharacterized protein n=1 Tax=Sporosarcina koreensis TaxID=334735 RepID=A0ABW0TZD9_9BACL